MAGSGTGRAQKASNEELIGWDLPCEGKRALRIPVQFQRRLHEG